MNIFRFVEHCIDYDIANNSIKGCVVATVVHFLGAFLLVLLLVSFAVAFPHIALAFAVVSGVLGFFCLGASLYEILRWKQ